MNYHICHNLQLQELKSVYNGSESIACLGLNISNTVPSELKAMSSISSFKKAIKEWYPGDCASSLCKTYYLYENVFRSWSDISMELLVDYFCRKLRLVVWLGFWICPRYVHIIIIYIYDLFLSLFYFGLVLSYSIFNWHELAYMYISIVYIILNSQR